MAFEVESKDGYLKHTFTGLRKSFPNLLIHKIINETICPLRVELMRRTEGGASGTLTDSLRTLMLTALQDVRNQFQEFANTVVYDGTVTLQQRKDNRNSYINRILDRSNTAEIEVRNPKFSNSDELLGAADVAIHSVTFNFEGNVDLDWAQPTRERVDHPVIREVIIGLDKLIVEMSRSHSADDPRTIIADEAAIWISDLDDIYAVVQDFNPGARAFFPTATSLNERENEFNADGSWDVPFTQGAATGEPVNTTRVNEYTTAQHDGVQVTGNPPNAPVPQSVATPPKTA